MTSFPTPAEISTAIKTASALAGVDSASFLDPPKPGSHGNPTARARWVAFGALFTLYPDASAPALARAVHVKSDNVARRQYSDCISRVSWRADWVDEVVSAIRPGWSPPDPPKPIEVVAPTVRDYETVSRNGVNLPRLKCLEVSP